MCLACLLKAVTRLCTRERSQCSTQTITQVPLLLLTQVKRRPDKDAGYATGLNRVAMKSR
jgi:hypothetical protein